MPHRPHVVPTGATFTGSFSRRAVKFRGDAGLALPLLYQYCEFFAIRYALGIPANCVFRRRATLQKKFKRRYRRGQLPQRSFSSFRHRARTWPRQRRIC